MLERIRIERSPPENNRQKDQRHEQYDGMQQNLTSDRKTAKHVGIHIPRQQRRLEKQYAGGPDSYGAAEVWEHHLSHHRLTPKQKKRAQKQRHPEQTDERTIHGIINRRQRWESLHFWETRRGTLRLDHCRRFPRKRCRHVIRRDV